MKFKHKLRMFLFPAILFPAVAVMAINFIITGYKIRDMQYDLLAGKVKYILDTCNVEYNTIKALGMENVDFYREATKKLVLEEVRNNTTASGAIAIVDMRARAIVLSTTPEGQRFLHDQLSLERMAQTKNGTGEYALPSQAGNPITTMTAFGVYAQWNWLVIAHADHQVVYRYLYDAMTVSALVVGLFATLFFVVMYRWSNGIVRSLQLLETGTMRIAAHNFDVAVAIPGNDEFGSLAKNFMVMAAAIQKAQGDLKIAVQKTEAANQELAASLQWNKAIITAIPDLLLTLDRTGTFLDCQGSEAARFLPQARVLGKNIADVLPPVVVTETMPAIAATLDNGALQTFEYDLNVPQGHRWFELRVMRLAGNQVLAIARDITDRKCAEEALRDSEERFRFVLDNSLDAAYRRNLQTDRYDYMSPVIEQVLGWSVEEMNRMDIQTVLTLLHPEDVLTITQEIERTNALCQATGRATGMLEYRMRDKHGEYRWVGDTITVLADAEGRPLYRLGIVRDITERKRAEEEIRKLNQELEQRVADRTAQLEAANKELEAFTYSVSHDLRAPLRHIHVFLGMLQERIAATLDEQSQHDMAIISGAAKRMGALIDDLLPFSRMGRSNMATRPVDLASLVREVIQELEPETRGRNIHWQIADLPVVAGDRAMLRMALVNLIANAVKFTRPREHAEIEIGCLPAQGVEVVVFVRDNGVGFDMQYADKLFGVFQRLHRVDEFDGTGIGLANVRRIISRHGGRTWAEGAVDHGATFYCSLPQITQGVSM